VSPTVRRGRGRQHGSVDGVVHRADADAADAGVTARRVANQVRHAASTSADKKRKPVSPTVRRGRDRQDGSVDGVVQRADADATDAGVTARRVANEHQQAEQPS